MKFNCHIFRVRSIEKELHLLTKNDLFGIISPPCYYINAMAHAYWMINQINAFSFPLLICISFSNLRFIIWGRNIRSCAWKIGNIFVTSTNFLSQVRVSHCSMKYARGKFPKELFTLCFCFTFTFIFIIRVHNSSRNQESAISESARSTKKQKLWENKKKWFCFIITMNQSLFTYKKWSLQNSQIDKFNCCIFQRKILFSKS